MNKPIENRFLFSLHFSGTKSKLFFISFFLFIIAQKYLQQFSSSKQSTVQQQAVSVSHILYPLIYYLSAYQHPSIHTKAKSSY
jgi:hypothetical protein